MTCNHDYASEISPLLSPKYLFDLSGLRILLIICTTQQTQAIGWLVW